MKSAFRHLFEPQLAVLDVSPLSDDAKADAEQIHALRVERAAPIFAAIYEESDALAAAGIRLIKHDFVLSIRHEDVLLRCFCGEAGYVVSVHGVADPRDRLRPYQIEAANEALREIAETMKLVMPGWV